MGLIDADALKEYIDAQKGRPFIGCTIGEALKIMTDEQPTVDAVPVIRCEDCKYFCAEQVEYDTPYGFTNFNWVCWCDKHTDYDNQKYLEVHTDDYCSWAERKDNATDRMDNQP